VDIGIAVEDVFSPFVCRSSGNVGKENLGNVALCLHVHHGGLSETSIDRVLLVDGVIDLELLQLLSRHIVERYGHVALKEALPVQLYFRYDFVAIQHHSIFIEVYSRQSSHQLQEHTSCWHLEGIGVIYQRVALQEHLLQFAHHFQFFQREGLFLEHDGAEILVSLHFFLLALLFFGISIKEQCSVFHAYCRHFYQQFFVIFIEICREEKIAFDICNRLAQSDRIL